MPLSSCDHDVFFCFAREDNAELPGIGNVGWIDEFIECITKLLPIQGVTQPRVMAHAAGNLPPHARADALRASALVVLVLSPAYFESEWCHNPILREALRELAAQRPDAIIVAEKAEAAREVITEFDAYPRSVFWRIERGVSRTLGFPSLAMSEDSATYYARASDLATLLVTRLRQLAAVNDEPPPAGATIFLAECSGDVEEQRLEVQRYLEQAGFQVLPRGRLPFDAAQFDQAAAPLIAEARLFVQLLGGEPAPAGRVLEVARRQLDLAVAAQREILQWRSPALELAAVSDPAHRSALLRETVQAVSIPSFCRAIKAAAASTMAPGGGRPSVFIDASRDNQGQLQAIFGRYNNIQWDWHEPRRTELKRVLRSVDGVILYWGSESSGRTQERYYLIQSHFKALKKSARRLLIYDGPPPDKPEFQGAGNWPVAKARNGVEPAELREFLKEIGNG